MARVHLCLRARHEQACPITLCSAGQRHGLQEKAECGSPVASFQNATTRQGTSILEVLKQRRGEHRPWDIAKDRSHTPRGTADHDKNQDACTT